MADPALRDQVLRTLEELHAAQAANDVDAMVETFAEDGFITKSLVRPLFEARVKEGAYDSQTADLDGCEVFVHDDVALVLTVAYTTVKGTRHFSYHLRRQGDGAWRIIESNRSAPLDHPYFTPELVTNAARLAGERAMLWVRRIDAPIERVWSAISTKEGLDTWWLTRDVEIDLAPGGLFKHHWMNTVRDFREMAFIDFGRAPEDPHSPDHLMRFEIRADGDATIFSFLDTFEGADSPLTLPWTSSGWHGTVDALEHSLSGREIENDFGLGGEFYWRYLRDAHKIADMVEKRGDPTAVTSDWRTAYLDDPL